MIVPLHKTKLAWLAPCAVGLSILLPLTALGQDPPATQVEIKAVARISRLLIDDVVTRREIVATVPYHARVLGLRFQGSIDGRAKLSVDMKTNQGDGIVIVHGQGTADTYARGVLGPVVAMGPAWGPFTSETVVRFDGRKFSLGHTIPWSEVHGELDRIETRHGGPVGRAAGRLVLPLGRAMVPRAERKAVPIANRLLVDYVNELGGKIVDRLNELTPVEKSLNRVFPQTTDWEFQLSTDAQFIEAAYGPPNAPAPVLPENSGRLKDTRLELWLRTTTKEAEALAKLSKQPLAKQLIQRYLEATLPELAALSDERTVNAVGPWLVISVGAPKAD